MRLRGPRFSLQELLLSVTLSALCLASWNGYHAWYRQNHGDEFINNQIRKAQNGDSVEDVAARLGDDGVDAESYRELFATKPNRPSGLRDSDQLLTFSVGRHGVTLQFREGKLVNHEPAEYASTGQPISLRRLRDSPLGYQISQLVRQMGVLQAVAAFVALLALLFAVAAARRRRYSASALKSIAALPTVLCTAIICIAAKVEPISLGCVIAGFTGAVAWNLAGFLHKQSDLH